MYQLDIHKIADCTFFLDFFFRGTELLLRGILYLYVDTFREHDLFSQEFLCLYITCVCVYEAQPNMADTGRTTCVHVCHPVHA